MSEQDQKLTGDETPLTEMTKVSDDSQLDADSEVKMPLKEMMKVNDDNPIRLTVRIKIPNDENPQFNFVGKLLGPRGVTLQQLQLKTQSRIMVMGRGSMKDKAKEEDLRKNGGAKYNHLNEDLHVMVDIQSSPWSAYGQMAAVLTELRKMLIPEKSDPISLSQREIAQDIQQGIYPNRGGPGSMRKARGGSMDLSSQGLIPSRGRGVGGPMMRGRGHAGQFIENHHTPDLNHNVDPRRDVPDPFGVMNQSQNSRTFNNVQGYGNYNDVPGDKLWTGSKSTPPSRMMNMSFHQQPYRPY